ncbi:hypothetical protein [Zooshikella harenae]|uniref:Uncharacterized protein n=1 Tax=Zooshikella harenae TaxID=2827238 RepID=A0ABS5ZEQ5_9GAMM|nr:hypothetical protein [Zooshikella harenae]MBU2712552.1 hypothetical protein [Zooshikella harenae]
MSTVQAFVETSHDDKSLFIDRALNKSKTVLTDIGFSCKGGVFSPDRVLICQSNETSLLSSAESIISVSPIGNKVQIKESTIVVSYSMPKNNSSLSSYAIRYLCNELKTENNWYINTR